MAIVKGRVPITKELLINRKPKSEYSQPLFINNQFNKDNWNGKEAIIRQFTYWLERQENEKYYAEFDYLDYGYEMIANWDYFEDQTYVTITLRKYWHDAQTDEEAEFTYDTYLITYYKNRGKIDGIFKNGKLIDFDEYVYLLNIIEASGFEFEI
jgi:hypothetical protein